MNNEQIQAKMYEMAVELIEKRYPTNWGGAGIIHTANDSYFSSVAIETANGSAVLCIEVGAMLEAHKFNELVTHCLCVVRDDEFSPFKILSPCGICQERLQYWGDQVLVGVTIPDNDLKFVELKELQPYHWMKAYPHDELEHYNKVIEKKLL